MKFACFAALATTSAITSHNKVATSDVYYGGIGPVEGWTFPQMGGENGDQVAVGAYTSETTFFGVFDTAGTGLLSGLNTSTPTAVGSLQGFGDFTVSKGSPSLGSPCAAFVSSISGVTGVFVQLPNGEIATVATTNTTFAPANSSFSFLGQPSVEISEDLSTVYVAFAGRAGSTWRGIILASLPIGGGEVSLEAMADTSSTIPNTASLFKCLSSPKVTRKGHVIFFGSHCGSTYASQIVQEQFKQLVMFKTEPVLNHALTRHREVGVNNLHAGLWRSVGGVVTAVVDYLSTVPDGNGDEHFTAFSDAGLGLDGTVSFVALGSNGSFGIYKDSGSGITTIANRKMNVPGTNCPFASFPEQPSIDAQGRAVFFGQCDSENTGVYYETSSAGEFGTIINAKDKVEGQVSLYIGFGPTCVSGNKASVYVVLNDTTAGVWAFDVPKPQESVLL